MDNKQTMRYFRMGVGVSLTDAEANFILGASNKQAGALLGKLMKERGFCVDGDSYEATDESAPSRIIGGIEIANSGWSSCFSRVNGVMYREQMEIKVKVNGTEYDFEVYRPEKDDERELRVYSYDEDCIYFLSENDDEPALLAENVVCGLIDGLRDEYEANPDQWGRDHYYEVETHRGEICDLLEEAFRDCLEY